MGIGLRTISPPSLAFLLGILLFPLAGEAVAQQADARVPANGQATALFDTAVEAFRTGQYAEAAGLFSQVSSSFELHDLTTAAALMEAKSLYRVGAFERAVASFDSFLRLYPTSRYVTDAERSRRLALDGLAVAQKSPVSLGVVLSMADGEASATQALFNGIRLAVEAHNQIPDVRPVRLIFRDLGSLGPDGAVASLAEAGASTIVGALFSDQARAVAAAAEQRGVVFVAPLATDSRVTLSGPHAFQANASIPMRGRLMARFAVNGLRLSDVGVIAERDDLGISQEMGRAFAQEAEALGATVHFMEILENARDWFSIRSFVPEDTLRSVEAIYAPLSGSGADQLAGALLASLDGALGLGSATDASQLRVLGNAEWHDLPIRAQASRYTVTYSNDFHFDETTTAAQAFIRRYRNLSGATPNRLGVVGYDLTRYLIEHVDSQDPERVRQTLLSAAPYEGLGIRIHFGGEQTNRQMYYHRYRNGALELMR